MHRYRNLRVWQQSVELARDVYRVTETFPSKEQYSSASQMRRAALSIASNIAESCSRRTAPDFRRFLDIAMGSAYELDTQIEVLVFQEWFSNEAASDLQASLSDIRPMIYGLRRSAQDQRD